VRTRTSSIKRRSLRRTYTKFNQLAFLHYRLTWIQHDSSLVQLSQPEKDQALANCEGGMQCLSCGLQKAKETRAEFRLIPPRGFFQRCQKYHPDDYVYILPSDSSSTLYKIGRITKVKAMDSPPQAYVRLYGRYDDVVRDMRKKGPLSSSLHSDEVYLMLFPRCLT
jgi:DNA (cytosine-5)-methyltransferase 1